MSDHLSVLELDEVAAGSPAPEHLATCADCQARVAKLKSASADFLNRAESRALEQRLVDRHASTPRGAARWLLVVAPLAASLLLFFLWPQSDRVDDPNRVKGSAMVLFLDTKGQPVNVAHPGDRLSIAVRFTGSSSRPVELTAVDEHGGSTSLWKGVVQPNERQIVTAVDVTPGDVTVVADLTDNGAHEIVKTTLDVQ